MSKSFFTIFPNTFNVHLIKDVGTIPYCLGKEFGWNSYIVCNNNDNYEYIKTARKDLNLIFLQSNSKYTPGKIYVPVISFLLKNSKKIDVLNLYHWSMESIIYALIFKLFNKNGFVYLKLDFPSTRNKINGFLAKLLAKTNIINLISYENEKTKLIFEEYFNDRLVYIPNFLYESLPVNILNSLEKENIVLLVGRIGEFEKNHEFLLEALTKAENHNYCFVFVGPINNIFAEKNSLIIQKLEEKKIVKFVGSISDRNQLFGYYNKSKYICITSRWEGFPIVIPEALYFGNSIITSKFPSALDIYNVSPSTTLIFDINNIDQLINIINTLDSIDFNTAFHEARNVYFNHFSWEIVVNRLNNKLNEV